MAGTADRHYRHYMGPIPPPELGPFEESSLFLIIREEVGSAGTPGALGTWGIRFIHVPPGDLNRFGLRKMPSLGHAPPPTSLLFTGDGGTNTNWTISGPEVEVFVDWSGISYPRQTSEALGYTFTVRQFFYSILLTLNMLIYLGTSYLIR